MPARRSASPARRGKLSAEEPLALLLSAQTAQLAGDRDGAERAFRAMAARSDTKLLGLRGLYVEAQRRDDAIAARRYAERAAEAAPGLSWAGQAVLQYRTATGDWAGALAALDSLRRGGQVDRDAYRRQRAVLLTARALGAGDSDTRAALAFAREAATLAPDLAPAAALAGRLLADAGELRKAAKVLEAAWRAQPHPDLAETYAHLRSGNSARERLARVQSLVRTRPNHVESAFAVARAALDAQEFAAARAALAPLAAAPTQRAAMLMAELEEMQHGDVGRAREWMGRALRAPRDAAWVADGFVSDQWMPLSPVTGRLDAFEWKPPPGEPPPTLPALPERLIEQQQEAAPPEESPRPTTAPEPVRLGRNGGAPAAAPAGAAAVTAAAVTAAEPAPTTVAAVEEVEDVPLAPEAPRGPPGHPADPRPRRPRPARAEACPGQRAAAAVLFLVSEASSLGPSRRSASRTTNDCLRITRPPAIPAAGRRNSSAGRAHHS